MRDSAMMRAVLGLSSVLVLTACGGATQSHSPGDVDSDISDAADTANSTDASPIVDSGGATVDSTTPDAHFGDVADSVVDSSSSEDSMPDTGVSSAPDVAGLFGGSVLSVVADPHASGTVYAVARPLDGYLLDPVVGWGPPWKTTDGGAHWSRTAALGGPFDDAGRLLIDPSVAGHVYAIGRTIWATVDGGDHWVDRGVPGVGAGNGTAIAPSKPSVLYTGILACTTDCIYRSDDGAVSWNLLKGSPNATAIYVSSTDENTVLARGFAEDPIRRSNDGGKTWNPIATKVTTIAFEPKEKHAYGISGEDFMESTDDGLTWKVRIPGAGAGPFFVDPTDATKFFYISDALGPRGIQRMELDSFGGAGFLTLDWGPHHVADVAFDSTASGTAYVAAGAEGIFKTVDRGDHWTNASQGMNSLGFGGIASAPSDPKFMYAYTDRGLLVSRDRGDTWKTALDLNHGRRYFAVAPSNASVVYARVNGNVVKCTRDAGTTWSTVTPSMAGIVEAIGVAPDDPATAFVGDWNTGLHVSHDYGATWSSVSVPADDVKDIGNIMVLSATRFVLTTVSSDHYIATTDGGATWTTWSLGGVPWGGPITGVPTEPDTLYATTSDGLKKTTDFGKTWSTVLAKGSFAAIDRGHPLTVYAIVSAGVVRSDDGGTTWTTAALGTASADSLAVDSADSNIVWATLGMGGVVVSRDGGKTFSPPK